MTQTEIVQSGVRKHEIRTHPGTVVHTGWVPGGGSRADILTHGDIPFTGLPLVLASNTVRRATVSLAVVRPEISVTWL